MNNTEHLEKTNNHAIRFSIVNTITLAVAILLAIGLFAIAHQTNLTSEELQNVTQEYIDCETAVVEMSDASNYLTNQTRMFVLTHEPIYLQHYITEARNSQRREHALKSLEEESEDEDAWYYLDAAMDRSIALEQRELYAMKLVVDAKGISDQDGADGLSNITLTAEDASLSDEEKLAKAKNLAFDSEYQASREYIDQMTRKCKEALVASAHKTQSAIEARLDNYLLAQKIYAVLLLAALALTSIFHFTLILRPLRSYTARLKKHEEVDVIGAAELQQLARAYNSMYEQNETHQAHLTHAAEHDPLTDLFNRSAYDKFYKNNLQNQALLLIDIDYFKNINDDYGHDVGDEVLRTIAKGLRAVFRSTDYPCRIGGDEFAVIMPGMDPSLRRVIEQRVESIRGTLASMSDGLPEFTLSIGIAFSEDASNQNISLYKAADIALYHVKDTGRDGYAFYPDLNESERSG